jgi:agmatinase
LTRYEPADSFETPRFSGVRTFSRLPHVRYLQNVDAVIVGAPFDTWDSYFGKTYNPGTVFRRAVEERLLEADRSVQIGVRGFLAANVAVELLSLVAIRKAEVAGIDLK